MDKTSITSRETAIILIIIILFAIFGLWLRFLPMEQLTSGAEPRIIFMDPWYSMRQIEVIASNFPMYPWFDPMNGYPAGKDIDWGPVYPTFSALMVILSGAATRAGMMTVASWIPPLLSLAMIPVMFHIARIVSDRKAGIIAACLISVIAGEYLYRSFYGYLDHHFMEVLFSSVFMLCYFVIFRTIRDQAPEDHDYIRTILIYSAPAGLAYYLGIMNIPTMVLFAAIVGLFCLFNAIITRDEQAMRTLGISHTIIFLLFSVLFLLTGIHAEGYSLHHYSVIHILLALLLIAEPFFLSWVIRLTNGKPSWQTAGVAIGIPAAGFLLLSVFIPAISEKIIEGFNYFFFFSYKDTFINEMQMWELTRALHSFNLALLIMLIGLAVTGYRLIKRYDPVQTCALIWAGVILISTILHLRYEYYAAVIVVLFSSVALGWFYEMISARIGIIQVPSSGHRHHSAPGHRRFRMYLPAVLTGIIILIITILSAQITYNVAINQVPMIGMNDDWADGLGWLASHTPDTGVDPLKIYEKEGFSYPDSAYGILSWWDYGHWITYLGQRIPITTPFQNNVTPVARFFVATSEKVADTLAEGVGARYIIIDYEMINSKYPSLPLWAFGQKARDRYQAYFYQQAKSNPSQYNPVLTLKPDFFTSMVSRLYIFDGSHTNSTGGSLVRYSKEKIGDAQIPLVMGITPLTPEQAEATLSEGIPAGTDLVSIQYTHPVPVVPALTHYRLVYESPTVTASDELAQLHNVKIFERVPGYRVKGTGIIELPLITNQGRNFTYRQESVNGTFTLPYATTRDGDGVRATGPYHIVGTGQTIEVSEDQVQNRR